MKTPTARRAFGSRAVRPAVLRSPTTREQLPLRSLPDCLLAAYDEVSQRAFSRFVARGSTAGSEIADWRAAEKDLFLPVAVDFADTVTTLYALATVAGCSGTRIEVAIEDRWLLIWGHLDDENECEDEATPSTDGESSRLKMKWIDLADLHSGLKDSEESGAAVEHAAGASGEGERWEVANPVTARPFCVIELPAAVDVSRSTAVLSEGLIAIRMPKPGKDPERSTELRN
jgi:HSP20 family molecular chaperone IbpA